MLTQERLREVLRYEPETGLFYWRQSGKGRPGAGAQAGYTKQITGYVVIAVDQVWYSAHRLAWLYEHGVFPEEFIDHINGVRDDNRIVNLRAANSLLNQQNQRRAHKRNKLGLLGVVQRGEKFAAFIKPPSEKARYLGRYATAEEAHTAYLNAKRQLHEGNTL